MLEVFGLPETQGVIGLAAFVVGLLSLFVAFVGVRHQLQRKNAETTTADPTQAVSEPDDAPAEPHPLLPLPEAIIALQEKTRDWSFERVMPKFDPWIKESRYDLWEKYRNSRITHNIHRLEAEMDFPLNERLVVYALLQTCYSDRLFGHLSLDVKSRPLPRTVGMGFATTFKVEETYDRTTASYNEAVRETCDLVLLQFNDQRLSCDGYQIVFHVQNDRDYEGVWTFKVYANGPDACHVKLVQEQYGSPHSFGTRIFGERWPPDFGKTFPRKGMDEVLAELFHYARCIAEFGYDPGAFSEEWWVTTFNCSARILYGSGTADVTPHIGKTYAKGDQIYYAQSDFDKGFAASNHKKWIGLFESGTLVYVAKRHGDEVRHEGTAAHRDDHVLLMSFRDGGMIPVVDPRTKYISDVIYLDRNTEPPGPSLRGYAGSSRGVLHYLLSDIEDSAHEA